MGSKAVKFEEILLGAEFVGSGGPLEHEAYLSRETGEIHYHSDSMDEPLPGDIGEAGKYVALPHKNDLGLGKALVFRFAGEFMPGDCEKVRGFFFRPAAFARFKDLLEYRGLLKQWYDYENKAFERALRDWCKDNEINLEG